jgi:hypothetical protein
MALYPIIQSWIGPFGAPGPCRSRYPTQPPTFFEYHSTIPHTRCFNSPSPTVSLHVHHHHLQSCTPNTTAQHIHFDHTHLISGRSGPQSTQSTVHSPLQTAPSALPSGCNCASQRPTNTNTRLLLYVLFLFLFAHPRNVTLSATIQTSSMMSRSTTEVDQLYDDDPGSLAVSLESFNPGSLLHNHSIHSIYRSEESEPESDRSSAPWSPPAWRKGTSGWQQRHHLAPPTESKSRTGSKRYSSIIGDDGDDTLLPAMVPLPDSPEKQTPRNSMDPYRENTEDIRAPSPDRPSGAGFEREESAPAETGNCA